VGSVLVGWDQVWWGLRGAGSGQVGWDDVGKDQVVSGGVGRGRYSDAIG
jgi:hypothetical protein